MTDIGTTAGHKSDAGGMPLTLGLALFAPIVLLGNEVGALLRYPEIGSAVLYPPYAALTAAVIAAPRRQWIWYVLVGAVAHFIAHWPHWSLSWIMLADVANIARALTAAFVCQWLFHDRPKLDSTDALGRFVLSTVVIAPAVGATIGAANVVLHGPASSSYVPTWRAWFVSNALTGLTMMPAFVLGALSISQWVPRQLTRRRILERLALACGIVATCVAAGAVHGAESWELILALYAPLPVLLWAALRFTALETSLALAVVTFAAIIGADRNLGPFVTWSPDESVLVVQLFVVLTSFTILCISAVSSARRRVVQLHQAILASAWDRIAIVDSGGGVVEVNDSWRRFAEGARVEGRDRALVGNNYLAACAVEADHGDATASQLLSGLSEVLDRKQPRFEMEYDDVGQDQRKRYAFRVEALEHRDGGAVIRHTDVTARYVAQIQIEEQRRELSHLARVSSLGQLSGALAHELNQPLAAISSNAEAARVLVKKRSADMHVLDDILRDILTENYRAAEVIRRLRALLRRGESRLQPQVTAELIAEVLELAHAELITRRVIVTSISTPNIPMILGDRVQVQQVLLNLILNACEAMRDTPLGERRLSITASPTRNFVQISVRDCGTGIPPSMIDRLFEPFFTTKTEGLGLGLSISRTIVAAHGGRLWAENNAGGGAILHCLFLSATTDAHVDGSDDRVESIATLAIR